MGIDFSQEDWGSAAPIFDGGWVVAQKHNPGLNQAIELNNRTFVFRLKERGGDEVLLAFGCGGGGTLDAARELQRETGLALKWVVGNGGQHHLFLERWYEAFPDARVLVPAKRVPHTLNGQRLREKYKDRWELMEGPRPAQLMDAFGDQIEVVIFDQLLAFRDETQRELGGPADHGSKPIRVGGFGLLKMMMKMQKDLAQPTDEVFLFHKRSGLVVAGHNFPFSYVPKGYKPAPRFALKNGGFPANVLMRLMMPPGTFKSALELQPAPVVDAAKHAAAWESVLQWDVEAWATAHDPPTVSGPPMSGEEITAAVRASVQRSGEDDPTGARLLYNRKHRK